MGVVYDFSLLWAPTDRISAMRLAAMFFSETTSRKGAVLSACFGVRGPGGTRT